MSNPVVEELVLDLLEWLAKGDRDYVEVMDAWRTSCPKLPVWEDANEQGFVVVQAVKDQTIVRITPSGREFLGERRVSVSRLESCREAN
jgi:DNA-binding PadR family transcriptional regulator